MLFNPRQKWCQFGTSINIYFICLSFSCNPISYDCFYISSPIQWIPTIMHFKIIFIRKSSHRMIRISFQSNVSIYQSVIKEPLCNNKLKLFISPTYLSPKEYIPDKSIFAKEVNSGCPFPSLYHLLASFKVKYPS